MNVFDNQNYYPYGTQVGSMYPNQPAPQPKYTQPLTDEQIKELQKTSTPFTTKIDKLDLWRSWCTHRKGKDTALVQNADGTFTCSICGAVVDLEDYSKDEVQEICDKYLNLLNNIKTKYYDAPEDVITEIMQIIPYVQRTPKLYEIANDNFSRYAGYNPNVSPATVSPVYGIWNGFNMMHGGYPVYAQQAVPQYQQPMNYNGYPVYGQPDPYAQQPMSNMQMQQSQMVAGNPLYAQPAPMPQQPVAPQQTAPQNTMTAQPQQDVAATKPAGDIVTTSSTVAL